MYLYSITNILHRRKFNIYLFFLFMVISVFYIVATNSIGGNWNLTGRNHRWNDKKMHCEKFTNQFAQLAPKCRTQKPAGHVYTRSRYRLIETKIILICIYSNYTLHMHIFPVGKMISFLFFFLQIFIWYLRILYNLESIQNVGEPLFDLILHIFHIFWRRKTSLERNSRKITYEDWRFTIGLQDSSQECRVFLLFHYLSLGDVYSILPV